MRMCIYIAVQTNGAAIDEAEEECVVRSFMNIRSFAIMIYVKVIQDCEIVRLYLTDL